ncbi:hypothetical protein [Georgenia alba]|uniref:Uncharacterized protein n=1 Tax=Georgenia alba TaxID=2233858 RepID=A0ABW2QAL5_9MICO
MRGWRRRWQLKKVKPGDGSPLKPYRGWHVLWRTVFTLDHAGHEYALDVDFFDLEGRARFYRDGSQVAVAEMPAAFPVPDGAVEAASSTYGMRRAHLVLTSGQERQLDPAPRTGEAWRARLAERRPGLSRALATGAVVVLVAALLLGLPQAMEQLSRIPVVADHLGTFTSPVTLPAWLNTALGVAGVLAALERALSLRHHWLIDGDGLLGD